MWHVSPRSGVATLRTATHLLLTNAAEPIEVQCGIWTPVDPVDQLGGGGSESLTGRGTFWVILGHAQVCRGQ